MKEIYPIAKISTIKKYAKKAYHIRGGLRKYDTKQFVYLYNDSTNEVTAMHKSTKQMFKWSSKTRKWRKLNYTPETR